MRKIIALLMVIAMMIPLAVVATAAEKTTTLTVEVPQATYTLYIPVDQQDVEFGATLHLLTGSIYVDRSSGFTEHKHLDVTVTYDAFCAEGVDTKIPFTLALDGGGQNYPWESGTSVRIPGKSDGTLNDFPVVDGIRRSGTVLLFEEDAWAKALAGTYTTTLTFTSEIVVE